MQIWNQKPSRIAVIGNAAGGKSTLARALSQAYNLPMLEVDSIQYQANWEVADPESLHSKLQEFCRAEQWVIDGFGPLDCIQERFAAADRIVWVDHPLWVHNWWAAERQIAISLGEQREGGPPDCSLADKTEEMFRTIAYVHEEIRPKILEFLQEEGNSSKLITISSPKDLEELLQNLKSNSP